jgi:hypothetical protein
MRSVKVEYGTGQELFEAYWNFLRSGGLVLRGRPELVEGALVDLVVRIRSLKKQWTFVARVARVDSDGRVFVAFEPGQAQDKMINAAWADTYQVPERRHRRFDVRAQVSYEFDGERHAATLTNLSRGGCRIVTPDKLPVGARLYVSGPDLVVHAQVRWSRTGREAGLEFAEPLEQSPLIP